MRCNYVLYSPFSMIREQIVWVGQSLGRTVEDATDIWCALRESYVCGVGPVSVAVKVTYFDVGRGTVDIDLKAAQGNSKRTIKLTGTGEIKTATVFVNDAVFSARGMDYDIVFRSAEADAVLSFVRVIRLKQQ